MKCDFPVIFTLLHKVTYKLEGLPKVREVSLRATRAAGTAKSLSSYSTVYFLRDLVYVQPNLSID